MLDAPTLAAMTGATELFLGRREGLRRFDLSVEGFWHSFGALIYVLPFYAIVIAEDWALMSAEPKHPPLSSLIAARLIVVAAQWFGVPIGIALLAKRLGITRTFGTYVIVSNWSSVVVIVPFALVSLLLGLGLASMDMAELLWLVLNVVAIFYEYRIVRWTLNWNAGASAGLVAAVLALSLILGFVVNGLFGL